MLYLRTRWILLDIERKYAQVEHSPTTRHAEPYDKYQTFSLFVSADASDRGETRRGKTFVGSVDRMIDDVPPAFPRVFIHYIGYAR